jgi:hypothetical protein
MGRGNHVNEGLEVRLEPPPSREPTEVVPRPEPEGETLLLIGVNRAPEPVFVRPVVRFVHGGWFHLPCSTVRSCLGRDRIAPSA